jgi:spore maturation protein CgeB
VLSRIRRVGLQDRLARALRQNDPAIELVLEGSQLPAPIVAELKRESGALWVNWFCDERRTRTSVEALSAAYDLVFVAGSTVAEAGEIVGLPPLRYLPPGCDPSVHRPMRSRDRFRANVVFAGTATPHRERMLSDLVEFGLAIWGPGWRRTKLRDYCRGELLEHADYIRAYAGASVAVNVQCAEESEGTDLGCNRRLFELAAIGVPQVVEDRPDIHRHFREGSEILVARSMADFKTLLREALQDRPWSEEVAAGARQRALSEHTYMHRLGALLNAVDGAAR